MPLVVIRTAGDARIGFGHIRRTMTLAEVLVRGGASVVYLLEGDQETGRQIADRSIEVVEVGKDPRETTEVLKQLRPQALVVDRRGIPEDDLRGWREAAGHLGVIDDLGDLLDGADLILNSNLYADELPYARKPETVLLLGPKYALLREAFAAEPQREVAAVRRILIMLGGSDPTGLAPSLVSWTRVACPGVEIDVVAGPYVTNLDAMQAAGPDLLLIDPPGVREVMLDADLAVSGGGQTTYELAATASAVLGILIAEDQRRNLEALNRAGVLTYVGDAADPRLEQRYRERVLHLTRDPQARERMGKAGRALVDGRGARRAAAAILDLG